MSKAVKSGFEITTNKKAKALTTILYDVHILGDYSCTTCKVLEPLCSIERLKDDIIKKGIERLIPYNNSRNTLVKKIKNIRNISSDKDYANQILLVLKEDLPTLLSEHSKIIFDKEIAFQNSSFNKVVKYFKSVF